MNCNSKIVIQLLHPYINGGKISTFTTSYFIDSLKAPQRTFNVSVLKSGLSSRISGVM